MKTSPFRSLGLGGLLVGLFSCTQIDGTDQPSYQSDSSSLIVNDAVPPNIAPAKSVLIRSRVGFSKVEAAFPMGRLMLDLADYVNAQTELHNSQPGADPRALKDPQEFALHAFNGGATDVRKHNDYTGVRVGTVRNIYNSFESEVLMHAGQAWAPSRTQAGPFRLLAVVNRLDSSGDYDSRGGGEFAAGHRKWFGEGRLIFGLNHDLQGGLAAYPMTFIVEYQLPALREDPRTHAISVDPDFDFETGPVDQADWKMRRKLWARVWSDLSGYTMANPVFQTKLLKVVETFATGENFIALRTGERVQTPGRTLTDEFEYREFYINGAWNLSTRKLRREPFKCAEKSDTLATRIGADWNVPESALHYDYALGDRNLNDAEYLEVNAECGGNERKHKLPFDQGEDDIAPFQLRAKFARFTPETFWTPNVDEAKRHAFALGSCTGCHAAETGTPGFVVAPRLASEDSILAPVLLTGSSFTAPTGERYDYAPELEARRDLMLRFLREEDIEGERFRLDNWPPTE